MKSRISLPTLRFCFGSLLLSLLLCLPFRSAAQLFQSPLQGAFSIADSVDAADDSPTRPIFADMDNDGDLDLLIFVRDSITSSSDPAALYQENIGTATAPDFGPVQQNPFNINMDFNDVSYAFLDDADGDGDLDIYTSTLNIFAGETEIRVLDNIGTASSPSYASTWQIPSNGLSVPSNDLYFLSGLDDLDGDSDKDALILKAFGGDELYFQENTSTTATPSYSSSYISPAPFGLDSARQRGIMDFVDFDNDGDLDVFYSEFFIDTTDVNIFYQENTGSSTSPSYAAPIMNPFGLDASPLFERALLDMADLDGDGSFEMIVGTVDGQIYLYTSTAVATAEPEALAIDLQVLANPVQNTFRAKVNSEELLRQANVRVFNSLGQLQYESQEDLQPGRVIEFSTAHWAPGLYTVQVLHEGKQYSERFQKQ